MSGPVIDDLHAQDAPAPRKGRTQKYLGWRGLIALIILLSAFVPLSTDLYLPALPGMAEYFGVSVDLANLTLILFFVFFSVGTLSGDRSVINMAAGRYFSSGFLFIFK